MNPWIPWEVHTSPHDIRDYPDPLFPVCETEIGRLGAAICYDWLFPEAIRELALQGAEVLIRVSAYMDPWGATPPMDWWTVVNRCRALENMAYVVASNQGARRATIPRSVGPAEAWSSIGMGDYWHRRTPDPAKKSSSHRLILPGCAPNGIAAPGTTCSAIYGRKPTRRGAERFIQSRQANSRRTWHKMRRQSPRAKKRAILNVSRSEWTERRVGVLGAPSGLDTEVGCVVCSRLSRIDASFIRQGGFMNELHREILRALLARVHPRSGKPDSSL